MSMLDRTPSREVEDLLSRGFYSVAFQPIKEVASGEIFGYEGLLRGPQDSLFSMPNRLFHDPEYIDRAVMYRLDQACLERALRSGRSLARDSCLFLNVHGETLLGLARGRDDLFALVGALHLQPSNLILEISETTDRVHVRSIAKSLRTFREMGVRVALDDVGARYAWLHHLLWLNADFIKLERRFLRGLEQDSRKQDLVHGLAQFAVRMGARLIVEGVEREAQWTTLAALGVHLAQGYWIGRPQPAEHWLNLNMPRDFVDLPAAGLLD